MADIKVRVQAIPGGPVKGVQVALLNEDLSPVPDQPVKVTGDRPPGVVEFIGLPVGQYIVAITDYSLAELVGTTDGVAPEPSATGLAPRNNYVPVEVTDEGRDEQARIILIRPAPQFPATAAEKARIVQEMMMAAAFQLPAFINNDDAKLPHAKKVLERLFSGDDSILRILSDIDLADEPLETVQEVTQEDSSEDSTEESQEGAHLRPKFAPCATCNSFYLTPGTIYYRNYTWYQGCLYNPPCT